MIPVSAYAPGRVELLGNHTDYNQGVVLAAAIDRGLTVTGGSRGDGIVALKSRTLGREVTVPIGDLQPQKEERWANYPLGVTRELLRAGYAIGGFDAEVDGDLAGGGGLSSSAAFEVATACFLIKLHGLTMEPMELAKLCQRAENEFVGVRSGLLDQVTSVFGRADHVVYLDCRSESVRTVPFAAKLALVIAESGSKHSLLHSRYNTRREECAAAAAALGLPNLRSIDLRALEERRAQLSDLLYRRALHIVGENDRVWRAVAYLESGDAVALGELMNESHESSRANFENSTAELDLLVRLARALPGVHGARLTGGGFGGATVTLVDARSAQTAADQLTTQFASTTGRSANAFVCRLADGAAACNGLA
ncbi:MAG: galactokinase [Verrucomicrobiota bacterium]|nr:galactokinase [Verrucomicrobiota bacterium]